MIFLTLLTAIALSAVAGYYSVIGLAEIFPGSFWPVIIMGSTLEVAKLVTVSWLYRNWRECPILIKSYLSIAVTILMLITSMGIFGFLSKAHLEHSADNAPLVDKIALLDEKIKTEKENVEANRKIIKQYDEVVDQTMGRSTDEKGADKAQAIRRSQQKDRIRVLQEIQQSQATIAKYSEERAPLSTELKKIEADIGPIKYIAALAYDSEADGDIIDKAVRLVILLIIVVFDPLAILLLIAYNMSMKEKDDVEDFFKRVKETTKKLDKDAKQVDDVTPEVVHVEEPVDPYAYLKQPFKHFENLKPMVAKREDTVEVKKDNMIVIDDITGETIPPITHEKVTIETHNTRNSVMYEEHHVPVEEPVKKLEPKYDYDEPYSFKEKEVRDAGKF
jgi:biopolymer transport protein ExbB/TolQ